MNKTLQHLALVSGAFTFTLIILECALRFANYNPFGEFFENEGRAVFIRPSANPQRIFEATPNAKGNGWGTSISINRYGFRGAEYSVEKPSGTYRIAVLGDSITFGNNLPPDKNYPAMLEKLFAKNNQHVEVLNLALGGYDTLQEVATLEDIGLQFKPDLVIVGYCINDIGIASGNLNYIKRLQNYGNPVYRSRLAQFIRVQLDRIELINFTNTANTRESFDAFYKNSLADIDGDKELDKKMADLSALINNTPGKYLFARDYTQKDHIQHLRYGFEKLKQLQNEHGFAVSVLIIPYLREDDKNSPIYKAVYDIVRHEAIHLDFSTINLYPTFKQAGLEKLILKKNDGVHPNEHGHEIMATEIYKKISSDK